MNFDLVSSSLSGMEHCPGKCFSPTCERPLASFNFTLYYLPLIFALIPGTFDCELRTRCGSPGCSWTVANYAERSARGRFPPKRPGEGRRLEFPQFLRTRHPNVCVDLQCYQQCVAPNRNLRCYHCLLNVLISLPGIQWNARLFSFIWNPMRNKVPQVFFFSFFSLSKVFIHMTDLFTCWNLTVFLIHLNKLFKI